MVNESELIEMMDDFVESVQPDDKSARRDIYESFRTAHTSSLQQNKRIQKALGSLSLSQQQELQLREIIQGISNLAYFHAEEAIKDNYEPYNQFQEHLMKRSYETSEIETQEQ